MPKITAIEHLGFGKETTWGTAAASLTYVPFDSAKPSDDIGTIVDNGKRGNISADYNVLYTTQKSEFEFETYAYLNELGHVLRALFGKVTTTGASAPYTHTFEADKTQYSLSINHFNGSDERQYLGMIVDEVSIKGDAEGALTVTVKTQGKLGTVVTTTTPVIAASLVPLMGAFCSLSIAGSANTNLFGFEVTFKRNNKLVYGASNSADPTKAVVGTFAVTGKLTFDVEDSTEYAMYAAKASKVIVLTLGNDAAYKATLTFSKAFIEKASWDDGDENLRVDLDFRGVYNTTDAGPCKLVVLNGTTSY